jgi:hypothetical protein
MTKEEFLEAYEKLVNEEETDWDNESLLDEAKEIIEKIK